MNLNPTNRRERALSRIETILIVLLLVVLAVLALMWANQGLRERAMRFKCRNNVRSMAFAYKVFANDNDDKFPFSTTNALATSNMAATNDHTLWLHFQAMSNELASSKILICPADRERFGDIKRDFGAGADGLGAAGNAAVSYGGSLDASEARPNTILLLDRNLMTNIWNLSGKMLLAVSNRPPPEWDQRMHNLCGNAALADGSVQQVSNAGLADLVRLQGIATNRLLLPLLP